jgi:hypothetical protein
MTRASRFWLFSAKNGYCYVERIQDCPDLGGSLGEDRVAIWLSARLDDQVIGPQLALPLRHGFQGSLSLPEGAAAPGAGLGHERSGDDGLLCWTGTAPPMWIGRSPLSP